jgi:cytochrome c-type biogenesis protein CcmF
MMAELGQFALVMALIMATAQAFYPLAGAQRGYALWMAVARPAAQTQAMLLFLAFACLVWSFIANDFSLQYVARGSNSHLPLYYRIAAVWGAHEGSMLLWATILGLWTLAVARLSSGLGDDMRARVLGVMGLVSMGVLAFIIFTSNPFERLVPAPAEGNDLNPLLQDFGMTIHPPMLYMGYVGLSVAFSFAIAALLGGQLDTAWARWSRPWTLVAWIFLTLGITLGSWWAYYELGWGGWWFWDPVENASFMPWLVATALIHSLAVTEKRGAFKVWTVLLAIFAFSLSLLGTFLVRSGVLTSVHAFASDPARGLFILILLMVVVGGSLLLYGIRAPSIRDHAHYEWFSRENLLLLNNILLVTASASILLGTLYPLALDALALGKISVGSPYFATVFAPVMAPVFLLAGLAPMVGWRRGSLAHVSGALYVIAGLSLVAGVGMTMLWLDPVDYASMAGLSMALWLAGTLLVSLRSRLATLQRSGRGLMAVGGGFAGMLLAHAGAAVFLVGVVISNHYSVEKNVRMKVGDSVDIAGYAFRFEGVRPVEGPNFHAREGHFRVFHGDHEVAALYPQKRVYQVQRNPMTEAAIDAGLFRDLYVALGENIEDDDWTVRLYHKPFMRC